MATTPGEDVVAEEPSETSVRRRWPRLLRRALAVLVVLLLAAGLYLFVYEPGYRGDIDAEVEQPLVFAHRGYGDRGPDNSLAAAERAMTTGVAGVDVDGQLTKDGRIVIFHDLSLDRLTDREGKVADYTLAELKELDLATKYNAEQPDSDYEHAFVASFEEFVEAITPHGILMVELKVSGLGDTGIEREAIRILDKHDAFDRVWLSSFNPLVIRRLERTDERVQSAYIFMDTNWNDELLAEMRPEDVVDLPWIVRKEWTRRGLRKLMRPDMLSVNMEVAEETRERLIERGWPVLLWTPNDPSAIADAIAQRPYAVISDESEEVLQQLAEAGG